MFYLEGKTTIGESTKFWYLMIGILIFEIKSQTIDVNISTEGSRINYISVVLSFNDNDSGGNIHWS